MAQAKFDQSFDQGINQYEVDGQTPSDRREEAYSTEPPKSLTPVSFYKRISGVRFEE
jgi:hypothetical protein